MNPFKTVTKIITAPVTISAAIVADGLDVVSGNFIDKPNRKSVTGKTIEWIVSDDESE